MQFISFLFNKLFAIPIIKRDISLLFKAICVENFFTKWLGNFFYNSEELDSIEIGFSHRVVSNQKFQHFFFDEVDQPTI